MDIHAHKQNNENISLPVAWKLSIISFFGVQTNRGTFVRKEG